MTSEYILPAECEACGSENIAVRVCYDSGITRYVCLDCGFSRSLPKTENLKKRSNTSLFGWAKRIKDTSPYCHICGSKEDLEAHHIIPVSHDSTYKYSPTNGIVLCKRCHYLVHNKNKQDGENNE